LQQTYTLKGTLL